MTESATVSSPLAAKRDALLAQLGAFSRKLAALYGAPPEGAWLTERVWEATVVPALAQEHQHDAPHTDGWQWSAEGQAFVGYNYQYRKFFDFDEVEALEANLPPRFRGAL